MILIHLLVQPSTPMPDAIDNELIRVQSEVREFFGWNYYDDLNNASLISKYFAKKVPFGVEKWGYKNRTIALNELQERLTLAKKIFIIGASISKAELASNNLEEGEIIAADGAVGAIDNPQRLACVVTDFDGQPYLDKVAKLGQCFVAHAHGDNLESCLTSLDAWKKLSNPPSLILSHQVDDLIPGMKNFGGFTDGDRAVCLALALGAPVTKITLLGFSTTKIGEWSGQTNRRKKLQKLSWMYKILTNLGLSEQIEN